MYNFSLTRLLLIIRSLFAILFFFFALPYSHWRLYLHDDWRSNRYIYFVSREKNKTKELHDPITHWAKEETLFFLYISAHKQTNCVKKKNENNEIFLNIIKCKKKRNKTRTAIQYSSTHTAKSQITFAGLLLLKTKEIHKFCELHKKEKNVARLKKKNEEKNGWTFEWW